MKKYLIGLIAVVVILLGYMVYSRVNEVSVYSGWQSLGWVGEQGKQPEPDQYSGWKSLGWVGNQGQP